MSTLELLCYESDKQVMSTVDENLSDDERVLDNLLTIEPRYAIGTDYFTSVQNDVTSDMRRVLTTWMTEVCQEQCCDDVVLPLAANLLDRFLVSTSIKRCQFQLLGSVCLFIASKLRQCRPLGGELLCYYTDYSVTLEELLSWEMLVLGKLRWDISSVTAVDFLSPLIARIPDCKEVNLIRQHAQILITLCATEFQFSLQKASLVAVASLCVATSGLGIKRNFTDSMQATLQRATRHTQEEVDECIVQIAKLFASSLIRSYQITATPATQKRHGGGGNNQSSTTKVATGMHEDICQPETPTDVQDIHF